MINKVRAINMNKKNHKEVKDMKRRQLTRRRIRRVYQRGIILGKTMRRENK